jgi:potassium voltage-gated channel Eag-related subfamily H protein 8
VRWGPGSAVSVPGVTCTIHPASPPVRLWTAYMLVLTCTYVAFLEPIFVAFNTSITTSRTTAYIDLLAGAAFAIDVVVNFRSGIYYVCEGHVKLVLDGSVIAQEYLKSNFVIDFLAAVPFFVQLGYYIYAAAEGVPPHASGFAVVLLRALRLLRVVRLWKLFVSRRAMLGAEVWIMHWSGSPLVIFALSVVYWFAFIVNLLGCAFILTATVEGLCDSWVVQLGSADDTSLSLADPSRLCSAAGVVLPGSAGIYVSAVYFGCATLTSVGYGDVVAKTDPEKAVVVTFMLVGAFFIATFTGQMVTVLAKHGDSYAAEQTFKDKMVDADRFVKENELSPAVTRQVLSWVQTAYMPHERKSTWSDALLAELPVPVRAAAIASIVGERSLRAALLGSSPATFQWLAGRMQRRQCHIGHYICLEGEPCDCVHFSVSGALAILPPASTEDAAHRLQPLEVTIGRGHCIGGAMVRTALQPRGADAAPPVWPTSVQATVETALFSLPLDAFETALRLGRATPEERDALFDSLARADDMRRVLDERRLS